MGISSRSAPYRLLDAQEKFIYGRAREITTISDGFKCALVEKGVPPAKISVIPNWANEQSFHPAERDPELGERERLAGKFNVMYGGNIGTAQGLGVVLDAAELLKPVRELQFVLIGDGIEREALARQAEQRGLTNVRFLGPRQQYEMAPYFAYGDALLIHLLQNPAYDLTIPSKTYAYLASGRPILAAVSGDTADLVRRIGAGVVCPPGDPALLADAIRQLIGCPEPDRSRMGEAARRAFVNEFSRHSLVDRYEALFASLANA
jgi:glycosyltransferase involved in cell wall biosynthesis